MSELEQIQLQPIEVGNADFKDIIDEGSLLVDKTAKLAKLVKNKKVFFSRPRRLGKTLLTSMLKELFTNGAQGNKYFDGLAVQSLWQDKQCYPVIHLSLFELSNPDAFEHDLCTRLRSAFFAAGFSQVSSDKNCQSDILTKQLEIFSNILVSQTQKIVFLIDEWDYPLSSQLNNFRNFDKNRQILSDLFGWLRLLEGVRFTFVTGIGRYLDTSLFTGQDIEDLSMDPDFADLVGYTRQEVKTYFAPHIKVASKLLECSEDELLDQLKQQYDGFCFDVNAKITLYSPWSINSFFKQVANKPTEKPNFLPFWMKSANAPLAIRTYLKSRNVDLSFLDEITEQGIKILESDFTQPATFESISFNGLMVQTGYLTIKEVVDPSVTNPYARCYWCYFPNKEVESVYANVFLRYITNRWGMGKSWFIETAQQLHDAMHTLNTAEAVNALNVFLVIIPYDIWAHALENSFRTYICWALIHSQVSDRVREEIFNYRGRSDIEIEFADKLFVIELKRLPAKGSKNAAKKLADKAQAQIKNRNYGQNLATWQRPRINERYGLVLVIAEDTRQVRYWRLIALEQGQELKSGWVDPMPEPVRTREAVVEVTAVQNVVSAASASDSVANAREDKNAVDQAAAVVHDDDVSAAPQNAAPALSAPVSSSHEPATKPQAASSKPQASASKSAVPPQEQELRTTIQLLIELAAEHANDKNLVTIDPDQLTTRMISLYAKLKQAGTQFSRAGLTSMVRAVISASEATNESAAIKLDRAFLTDQLIATLQDQL